jgi:hypothetical protein
MMDMLEEAIEGLGESLRLQNNSRFASSDETRLAWIICYIQDQQEVIDAAKALTNKFVEKVQSGRARSRETYQECLNFLDLAIKLNDRKGK